MENCWNGVVRLKRDQLIAPGAKKRIGANEYRSGVRLRSGREGGSGWGERIRTAKCDFRICAPPKI
jgi:hypothetical protein